MGGQKLVAKRFVSGGWGTRRPHTFFGSIVTFRYHCGSERGLDFGQPLRLSGAILRSAGRRFCSSQITRISVTRYDESCLPMHRCCCEPAFFPFLRKVLKAILKHTFCAQRLSSEVLSSRRGK